jgi:hydroxymethylbilane synthase
MASTYGREKLNDLGYKTEIVAVKAQGDLILDKPLYELGITGIFTKHWILP